MKSLAIAGAGGHGRVVADMATLCGWSPIFFDDARQAGSTVLGWPYQGSIEEMVTWAGSFDGAVVAIGDNAARLALNQRLREVGAKLVSIVHPSATISQHAVLGAGSLVMPNAVVMTGAVVGEANIVNTAASVDHDCRLSAAVHVSPGARLCGGVTVDDLVWVGAGATVIPGVRVGRSAVIGAGSVVIRDVEANAIVVGNPARQMVRN